jgi:hypothetical protein
MESKSLENEKRRMMVQEVVEATPDWQMYCVLTQDENVQKRFEKADFWDKLI